MKKVLIIDTFNFLHRAFHALPVTLTDSEGSPTNAVYGVTSMLISILEFMKPDYAIAALDSEKPTFRVEDFVSYKAHRKPMDTELSVQIPKVFEVLDAFGVKKITVPGYEADDIIGTVVERLKDQDYEVIVASNDRDLWQLVSPKVFILMPNTKGAVEWLGEKEVAARLEFPPEQLVDYKGLKGDASDNIPGVHGVGEKAAKKLLAEFGSIENIYKNIDDVAPASLKEKLLNNYEMALMSKKLATIVTDVPMPFELEECRYKGFVQVEVKRVLEKYNFKSLQKRIGMEPAFGASGGSRKRGKSANSLRDNISNGDDSLGSSNQTGLFE